MSFEDIIHNKSFDFINSLNKTIAGTKVSSPTLQNVSLQIVIHLVSCISALRDTLESNQKSKTALEAQIVSPLLNGLMATVGKVIMDNFAFEPKFSEQEAFATAYCSLMRHAFRLFPDMAVKKHKASGKLLLHHAAFRAKAYIVDDSIQNILAVSPESASVTDNGGALALHWATRNPEITSSGIDLLIQGYPKGAEHADDKGFMPLHWAVNQDAPNMDVVRRLLKAFPTAARTTSRTGNLPLHYCVMRDRPNVTAVKALLAAYPDAISSRCLEGYLPLHRLVHRANVDKEALALLIKHYPDSLLQVTEQGQTPLLVALDFPKPDYAAVTILLRSSKEAASRADLGDYYPLHMCLDCAKPDYKIALELLKAYPDAARKETKEGLTPLHILVSTNAVIDLENSDAYDRDFIEALITAFPEALVAEVKDIVPVIGDGVSVAVELLESWSGEWVEQQWDVIGKARARNMDALAVFLEEKARPYLPDSYFSTKGNQNQQSSPTSTLLTSQPLKTLTSDTLSPLTKAIIPPRKFVLAGSADNNNNDNDNGNSSNLAQNNSNSSNKNKYNNNSSNNEADESVSVVQPFSVPPEVDEEGYDGDVPFDGRQLRRSMDASSRPADTMSETAVTVISSLSGTKTNTSAANRKKPSRAPPAGPIPSSLLQAVENSSAMRLSKSQYELLLGRPTGVNNVSDNASVSSSGTRRSRVSKKELMLARQQRQQQQHHQQQQQQQQDDNHLYYSSDGGGGGHLSENDDATIASMSDRDTDVGPSSNGKLTSPGLQPQPTAVSSPPPVVVQPRYRGPPPSAQQRLQSSSNISNVPSSNQQGDENNREFASKTAPLPLTTTNNSINNNSSNNGPASASPMGQMARVRRPEQQMLSSTGPLIRKADDASVTSPTNNTNASASTGKNSTNVTAEVLRSLAPNESQLAGGFLSNTISGKVRVYPQQQGHDMV